MKILVLILWLKIPFPVPDSLYSPLYKFRPDSVELKFIPERRGLPYQVMLSYPWRGYLKINNFELTGEELPLQNLHAFTTSLSFRDIVTFGLIERKAGDFITLKDSLNFLVPLKSFFISGNLMNTIDYYKHTEDIFVGGDIEAGYIKNNAVFFIESNPSFYHSVGGGYLFERGFLLLKIRKDGFPGLSFYYRSRGVAVEVRRDRDIFPGDIERFSYFISDSLSLRVKTRRTFERVVLFYHGLFLGMARMQYDEIMRPDPVDLKIRKFENLEEKILTAGFENEYISIAYRKNISPAQVIKEEGEFNLKLGWKKVRLNYDFHYVLHEEKCLLSNISLSWQFWKVFRIVLRENNLFDASYYIYPGIKTKRRYLEIGVGAEGRI